MNMRDMVSFVFGALGDPAENRVEIFGEVVRALNAGSVRVSNMLPEVERQKYATTYNKQGTAGTQEYLMPDDYLDFVRATYAGLPLHRHAQKDLGALIVNPGYRPNRRRQQFCYEISGTQGRTKIGIEPIPDNSTDSLVVTYVRKPTEFHDLGTTQGAVTLCNNRTVGGAPTSASCMSTTVFHDYNMTFAATETATSTAADTGSTPAAYGNTGFWNEASVRFLPGSANAGQSRRVVTFKDFVIPGGPTDGLTPVTGGATQVASYGRFVFDTNVPWYNTPAVGDKYEIDQVNIMPDQFHDLICLWACFLLAPKGGKDPKFFQVAFMDSALQMGLKHTQQLNVPTIGETPGGAR